MPSPHSVQIALRNNLSKYTDLQTNSKAIMSYIKTWQANYDHVGTMRHLADQLILFSLFPKTTNITISYDYPEWKNLCLDSCNTKRAINAQLKFRPLVWVNQKGHLVGYQVPGFIIDMNEFRFVSCHKERRH